MAKFGFVIKRLWLTGPNVPDAGVGFEDGLNVVSGASNTGKTFIGQCIDYVFGRSNRPKEIPEAVPYDEVHLEIQSRDDGQLLALTRSLRGGNSVTVSDGEEEQVVSATHSDNTDNNVSAILLTLCGLRNKRVTTNARGKTRSVSFRDISHLAIISEEQIIREDSPIHSKMPSEKPVRQSIFRLLITGVDDSSVVEQKEVKISRAENRGKGIVLEELQSSVQEKISATGDTRTLGELREQKEELTATLGSLANVLNEQRINLAGAEERRRSVWESLQRTESRQDVVEQLLVRFSLLSRQYSSDLERLTSINEVGQRLGELNEERCPVCGASSEHHNKEHAEGIATPEDISASAAAEADKIRKLQHDLANTISDTQNEAASLQANRANLEESLRDLSQRLKADYQPKVAETLEQYQSLLPQMSKLNDLLSYLERLEQLEELKDRAELALAAETSGEPVVTKISTNLMSSFCAEVERLLDEWQLPDRGRVTFSENAQDIVIGNRDRKVDGKGIRAITYAAFSLALNNYCVSSNMPTASFVILDSPLVVYRRPDESEVNFSLDVKANFYRQLAEGSADRQVIIFENDDPPEDLEKVANVVHFSKSEEGRYGFIPTSPSEPASDEEE